MTIKNKWLFTGFFLFIVLIMSTFLLYYKYNKYLPTASNRISIPTALNDAEIQQIRLNTAIQTIQVYKSKRLLKLLDQHETTIRQYPIRLGFNPLGHKVQEGDGKTPEGRYTIDWRNPKSAFYKSLHISYPNAADQAHAKSLGVSAGGDIMIHGSATTRQVNHLTNLMTYMPQGDWTLGCIAVRNIDMDEIWKLVDDKTTIEIYP